ncbi:cobalamin-independent methionine synthase II family protein [Sanguibacter inulinus]|uniref:Cobalamin-independent methionine synthase II family protein n=1 Tax=Sanguibacter inulinus TaxID=60922 RepID=A0A853EXN8_9MICO|nr:cobalamin-independent methionine synthase II family protein [Sanguibacter inulinus]MBF0724015.1 cobalamin-independent methionine synthase II family protein [Sanguibacter inulinus]NYS95160.1 cobalamin-independent methionine synthase II family protein [Sanguibacter inulinus]
MLDSRDRIQTTHAGSLPRTPELIAANDARQLAEDGFTLDRTPEFDGLLTSAVDDLVARQKAAGITVPGDGEFGKAMTSAVDYGAWWSYSFQRVSGLEVTGEDIFSAEPVRSGPGDVRLTTFPDRRDWTIFREAYTDPTSGISTGKGATAFPATTGKLDYVGHDAIASDIANLKAGLAANGLTEGFVTSLSPGSGSRIPNAYYATEEEHIWAWADVLREEYKAIVDAGLILQIDDPSIAENWDQINPEPSIEDYQAFTRIRVEALNYALRDLPQEQIRFHLCWGSWHGPHTTDLELKNIVDLMLEIDAGAYSFEAANARHEHEWKVWQDVTLPEGKLILPGIVGHATNVVEHPELVADRIERFASVVGKENVIASTDCGLGGRIHPQIAWAKLEALSAGAEIATQRLWG